MSQFLFSGIASLAELKLLETAFAESPRPGILLGKGDYYKLFRRYTPGKPKATWSGSISLDSDAFQAKDSKQNLSSPIALKLYVELAQSYPFHLVSAVDVFNNPQQTRENWDKLKHLGTFVPIWHWGSGLDLLEWYVRESDRFSSGLVGVGGLVPLLIDNTQRDATISALVDLAKQYPGRFHIFGGCHVGGNQSACPLRG